MPNPAFSTYSHPSANNVYLPNVDETLRLLVSYARDPKEFAINNYVTVSPISKPIGYYPKVFAGDDVRVPNNALNDALWADGTRRLKSSNEYNTPRHTFDTYTAIRYSWGTTVGFETIEYADGWDVKQKARNTLASRAMTARTKVIIDAIFDTTNNYPSNHVSTVSALGGDFWGAGTINNPVIKNTLRRVRDRVVLDTNGKVTLKDLVLVMNPTTAGAIASSQEIHAYLAQQANSLDVISGDNPSIGSNWGLPANLYGFKVLVDSSNIVSAKESIRQDTPSYLFPDNRIAVLARPGGIVSEGGINFSTVHVLEMKGYSMNIEESSDQFNRLFDINITDYFTPLVAAPESGFILNNVLS